VQLESQQNRVSFAAMGPLVSTMRRKVCAFGRLGSKDRQEMPLGDGADGGTFGDPLVGYGDLEVSSNPQLADPPPCCQPPSSYAPRRFLSRSSRAMSFDEDDEDEDDGYVMYD
jgi:hypothetical protein